MGTRYRVQGSRYLMEISTFSLKCPLALTLNPLSLTNPYLTPATTDYGIYTPVLFA
jgi:hypothetical protein